MKKAFIIHGAYGSPEENWIPWLRSELAAEGYEVITPTFPTPEDQNYDSWMSVIEPYLDDIDEETVLVGHSIGATFLLCILEKLNVSVQKTVLVSGFLGLLDNQQFDAINKTISNRPFDWDTLTKNAREFVILYGGEDPYVPIEKAVELGDRLNTEPLVVEDGGHLNADAGFTAFPELLTIILGTA